MFTHWHPHQSTPVFKNQAVNLETLSTPPLKNALPAFQPSHSRPPHLPMPQLSQDF
jgi:hypothetical protein